MAASTSRRLLYLWRHRTLFLGGINLPVRLSLSAALLIVGLDGTIRFRHRHQRREVICRSLLLPAGMKATVDPRAGLIASCHLDVFGFDYAVLRSTASRDENGACHGLEHEDRFVQALTDMHRRQHPADVAYATLDRLINPPKLVARTSFTIDPRVVETIARIQATTSDNLSVAELARQVDLSVSRLTSLFKRQVGVPIRRYRLWHRLYLASVQLANGASLTEAALEAGFADASHFSKTYRAILGGKPSLMFGPQDGLRVFAEPAAKPLQLSELPAFGSRLVPADC